MLRTEEAFQRCFEQLPTGVYVVRRDTYEILYCNTAMHHMGGPKLRVGALCYEALRDSQVPCRACYMQRKTGRARFFRWQQGDKTRDLSIRTALIDWEQQAACVVFCTDLTGSLEVSQQVEWEKQELLRDLEDSLKLAEKANQAKSEFLSRMSHDMRTPMNAIIGMTNIALNCQKYSEILDCLKKIQSSSQFLLSLINDILDVSKIENRQLTLSAEPYPLLEFTGQIQQIIQPLCKAKDINFSIIADIPQDSCILVDRTRFNQIFLNLLSNAVKYTPRGGYVEFSIENYQEDAQLRHIRFCICDTGIGMSKEFQAHMFEPFSQEDSHHVSTSAGTGLGLAIVKSLVDLMHGTIFVQSAPDCGTIFTIDLEVRPCPAPKNALACPQKKCDRLLNGCRVLLCEDNPLNTEVADWILQQAGMEVHNASDGKEAVEAFAASAPYEYDVILMDIRMPHMDGLEATRRIRSMERPDAGKIPIIAMTADAFAEDRQRSLQAGMNAHLSKPLEPDILYRTILRHI